MAPLNSNGSPSKLEPAALRSEGDYCGVVSETMREEEKMMKSVSRKEEENRIRETNAELREGDGLNGAAVDERFSKLDRLLSQSKVSRVHIVFEPVPRTTCC